LPEPLEARVARAAQAALDEHGAVSTLDVLTRMQLLHWSHVERWKQGRVEFLANEVQCGPEKLALSLKHLVAWAEQRGMVASEVEYTRKSPAGVQTLRIFPDAEAERVFRLQFVPAGLPPAKQQRLREKVEKPPERTAFIVHRDSACGECGVELPGGSLLALEGDAALCLPCGGLGDLAFVERGDAALTRRATRYSARMAVVLEWSRSRKRYERQGILAEPAALERAEQECLSDEHLRMARRLRAEGAREKEDRGFIGDMTRAVLRLFPHCPPKEAAAIAEHAGARGSGRVGRTAAARRLEEEPLTLAVVAAVRHRHTNYDELLLGLDRESARARVRERVDSILDEWRG
jgi:hypothetical protein